MKCPAPEESFPPWTSWPGCWVSAPPSYIEAYDISNIGAGTIVGGMVVLKVAPRKKYYRKFKMKTQLTPDDYASMRERFPPVWPLRRKNPQARGSAVCRI